MMIDRNVTTIALFIKANKAIKIVSFTGLYFKWSCFYTILLYNDDYVLDMLLEEIILIYCG